MHSSDIVEMRVKLEEMDERLVRYASAFVHACVTPDQLDELPWEALTQLGLPAGHAALVKRAFSSSNGKAKQNSWVLRHDNTQDADYYYNTATQEAQWDKPARWDEKGAAKLL